MLLRCMYDSYDKLNETLLSLMFMEIDCNYKLVLLLLKL